MVYFAVNPCCGINGLLEKSLKITDEENNPNGFIQDGLLTIYPVVSSN